MIIAGAFVWWLDIRWPDLLIGTVVAVIVIRGAFMILKDAKQEIANAAKRSQTSEE